MPSPFATALREARAAAGLTLNKTAQAVNAITGNMSLHTTISDYEHDRRRFPSPEFILALAQVLNTDPFELLSSAGKCHPVITNALTSADYQRECVRIAKEITG